MSISSAFFKIMEYKYKLKSKIEHVFTIFLIRREKNGKVYEKANPKNRGNAKCTLCQTPIYRYAWGG